MIPDNRFIEECAAIYGFGYIYPDFRKWFLTKYEDEPYPDYYDRCCLEGFFRMYYKQYLDETLDITIKPPYKRLQERYAEMKELIAEMQPDICLLENESAEYFDTLVKNGLI